MAQSNSNYEKFQKSDKSKKWSKAPSYKKSLRDKRGKKRYEE